MAPFLLLLLLPRLALANTDLICPRLGKADTRVQLDSNDPVRRFTEVSGAVFSKDQVSPETGNPIVYVVTDGDNNNGDRHEVGGGRIGVYDSGTGERLTTLALTNTTVENYDWEAMTLGSCGTFEGYCIYVGDVGDNVAINTSGRRNDRTTEGKPYRPYRFIKIREPHLMALPGFNTSNLDEYVIPNSHVEILPFDYNDATSPEPFSDCEVLFMDHTGWGRGNSVGDLYIITKWGPNAGNKNRIFYFPVEIWQNGDNITGVTWYPVYSPQAVGDYSNPRIPFLNNQWTGGDMTMDGTVISLSTPTMAHLFLRCPGETVVAALTRPSHICAPIVHPTGSGVETSAWRPDGTQLIRIPEGNRPRIGRNNVLYDQWNANKRVCPPTPQPTPFPTSSSPTPATAAPIAPTSYYVDTATPTEAPTTRFPTSFPTTRVPTPSPTTISPTSSPTTLPPTSSPTYWTYAPTASPTKVTSTPTISPTLLPELVLAGENGSPAGAFPLRLCEGDCDSDVDCAGNLICFFMDSEDDAEVPGCINPSGESTGDDFCIHPPGTINGEPTVDISRGFGW